MISFIFTNRTLERHRRKLKLAFNHERFRTFSLYDKTPSLSAPFVFYDYRFNNRDFKNIKRADGFVLSLIPAFGSNAAWHIFYYDPPQDLCKQWAEPTRKYRQRNASKKAKTDII